MVEFVQNRRYVAVYDFSGAFLNENEYLKCTSLRLGGNEIVLGLVAVYKSRRTNNLVFDT